MRKIYILILALAASTAAFGQGRFKIHHIIKKSAIESGYLPLIYKDRENKIQPVIICTDKLNGIVRINQGVPVVDFWPITNDDYTDNPHCVSKNTELGRFEIDLSRKKVGDPVRYIKVPFSGWIFGIGTTPFRYRPKTTNLPSAVSSQIGINLTFGKYEGYSKVSEGAITNYGLIIGPFAGITEVRLEKSTVVNPDDWDADRTNSAFTYGINIALTRNKLGIVLSLGYDHNFGSDAKYWGYQNKPWLGIGVNTYLGVF
ncbi:MAG: hypothetical protein ACTHK0_08855 [Ginsengibacter sp.]